MIESEQTPPELLAAEYVLGTLAPDARAQVEARIEQDPQLLREVALWERRLGVLGLATNAVQPPPAVWAQVQARTQPAQTQKRRPSSGLWVGFAIAASMAAFALASLLFVGQRAPSPQNQPAAPVYASLIQDEKRDLAWLVTADASPAQRLQIVAMGGAYDKTWVNRSLELWLLAPDAKPVSLGLLPKEGVSNVRVSPDVAATLAQGLRESQRLKLAVSNEPLGGSPTGAPTGEVLFAAALNQRDAY